MNRLLVALIFSSIALVGCGGTYTFTKSARSNDTVAVMAGWMQGFQKDNLTVTITDSISAVTVYSPADPAIRAVTNLYPDPVSNIVVDNRIGDVGASTYAESINTFYTDFDNDWWQTMVMLDLPLGMAVGPATIQVDGPNAETFTANIDIVAGTGTPDPLQTTFFNNSLHLTGTLTQTLERAPHYTVSFTGATLPHGIEITFTHDADTTAGGTGRALAINTSGTAKSLSWADTGTSMQVMLLKTNELTLKNIKDYKFYISGGITNLSVDTITAYDENGAVIPGIAAACVGCV